MNILIACEESQRVCISFREKGHNAYSCDVQPCSGGHPEWHIKDDCLYYINGRCDFKTENGDYHFLPFEWDLIIAHPPCTYLCNAGNRWYNIEKYGSKAISRIEKQEEAIGFFFAFVNANCMRIAIENPVGIMSTYFKKPSQIIQPYYFGDPERKTTCLWLKNLPLLHATNVVKPNLYEYKNGKSTDPLWHMNTINLKPEERQKERSKTFWGIAKAMADQWGTYLI